MVFLANIGISNKTEESGEKIVLVTGTRLSVFGSCLGKSQNMNEA